MSEKAPNDRFLAKYDLSLLNTFLDQKFYKLPKSKIWKRLKKTKKQKQKQKKKQTKSVLT